MAMKWIKIKYFETVYNYIQCTTRELLNQQNLYDVYTFNQHWLCMFLHTLHASYWSDIYTSQY